MSIENLVDLYGEELMRYLWRYLKFSQPDAEDCLQETYLRALKGFPRLTHHENLRAWMYKIATNVANSRLTEVRRSMEVDFSHKHNRLSGNISIEDEVGERLKLEEVAAAVDRLPGKQKSAFLMRKYQDLSYDEIAGSLDCSPESARANVYQALRRLREQFDPVVEKRRNDVLKE